MSNDGTDNSWAVCLLVVFTSCLGDVVHLPDNIKIADSHVCAKRDLSNKKAPRFNSNSAHIMLSITCNRKCTSAEKQDTKTDSI